MPDALPDAGRSGAIRLLWLIDSLTAGGAEALTAAFARSVASARGGGVELEVGYLKSLGGNPFEGELRAAGVAVTGLGARNLRDLGAFRRLLALLRSGRFDLVHAHLAYASLWGLAAGRLTGRPVVVTLHTRPPAAPAWSREGIRRRLLIAAGLEPERIEVVHNGVEPPAPGGEEAARALRRELGGAPDAPLVVTVSVLREGKGLEVLLDAVSAVVAAHPRARFAIVGDGPARAELQARSAAGGAAGAVAWPGFRRDVPDLLAAADLFVLPSHDDAFPTALLEAMAARLPVVATRTGGIPEIVEEGATGRLVPPGDAAALARAVSELLADPAARRSLGEAGQRRARERFSTSAWLGRLERVYGEVLGRPVTLRAPGRIPVEPGAADREVAAALDGAVARGEGTTREAAR